MKKVKFDVEVWTEHYDETEDVDVRTSRTKTFDEADYQKALDYYDKHKQAYDILYEPEEGGLYSCREVNGKEYRGEYREWRMPSDVLMGIHLGVRVMNN